MLDDLPMKRVIPNQTIQLLTIFQEVNTFDENHEKIAFCSKGVVCEYLKLFDKDYPPVELVRFAKILARSIYILQMEKPIPLMFAQKD